MRPSRLGPALVLMSFLAAACVQAPPAPTPHTATQATRKPTSSPPPTNTSTPEASPVATIPSVALPICSRRGTVGLDDMMLAFAADWDGDWEIYSVRTYGSELVQITDDDAGDSSPRWSPDGGQLAYVGDFTRMARLMIVDADGSNATMVAPDLDVNSDVVWSPTGRQIVLRSGNDLFAVDVQTGAALNLQRRAPFLTAELPSFSPEGERMVLLVAMPDSAGGPESRLFTVRVDGTQLTELSVPRGEVSWPSWHPTRDEILFEGEVPGEGAGLYVASLEGPVAKLKPSSRYGLMMPTWSPDGTMIAYVQREQDPADASRLQMSLHVATLDEIVDAAVLGDQAAAEGGASFFRYYWAPDSRHIAFTTTNEAEGFPVGDIYVFDICEGKPQLVVKAIEMFSAPSWRPMP